MAGVYARRSRMPAKISANGSVFGFVKDAVVSWETGRNELSATWARTIALVTGVDGRVLRFGVSVPFSQDEDDHVSTKTDFERHWRRGQRECCRPGKRLDQRADPLRERCHCCFPELLFTML